MNGPEEWKGLPDFIGYEVSSYGNLRTYLSANGKGGLRATARPVTQYPTPKKEYLRVKLIGHDGKPVDMPVHQAVLFAFHGPRPTPEHDSCHGDGNARNNHWRNLRWDTKQANADDRVNHGTQVRGEAVGLSVLTETQVLEIRKALPHWKKGMGREFAIKFGVGDSAIHSVKVGQTWKHVWPS